MTPRQCAAARGALGWDRIELSEFCGVSSETIRRFEKGEKVNKSTWMAMRAAFERNRVEFEGDDESEIEQVRWTKGS